MYTLINYLFGTTPKLKKKLNHKVKNNNCLNDNCLKDDNDCVEVFNNIHIINYNITKNTKWRTGHRYVIEGEVTVFPRACLVIEDGVEILFKNSNEFVVYNQNNIDPFSSLNYNIVASTLIFRPGSSLLAGDIKAFACDSNFVPVGFPANGGFIFIGTNASSDYNVLPVRSEIKCNKSKFIIKKLTTDNLGSLTYVGINNEVGIKTFTTLPLPSGFGGFRQINTIPLNSITFVGLQENECCIDELILTNSGANGIWSQFSKLNAKKITIINYVGNGIFVRDSQMTVHHKLSIQQLIISPVPAYQGLLINITELNNTFPPSSLLLGDRVKLSWIKVINKSFVELNSVSEILSDELNIENCGYPRISVLNKNGTGTFYRGIICFNIIFTRQDLNDDIIVDE